MFVIEVKINTTATSQEWTFPLEDKRLRHRQDAVGASGKMTSPILLYPVTTGKSPAMAAHT